MYARITQFKMNDGTRDAAMEKLHTLKDRIMGLPGMAHFINVMNEDGSGYVISLVDSKATSDANTDAVKEIWSEMAEFLQEPPKPGGFDVVADWS